MTNDQTQTTNHTLLSLDLAIISSIRSFHVFSCSASVADDFCSIPPPKWPSVTSSPTNRLWHKCIKLLTVDYWQQNSSLPLHCCVYHIFSIDWQVQQSDDNHLDIGILLIVLLSSLLIHCPDIYKSDWRCWPSSQLSSINEKLKPSIQIWNPWIPHMFAKIAKKISTNSALSGEKVRHS